MVTDRKFAEQQNYGNKSSLWRFFHVPYIWLCERTLCREARFDLLYFAQISDQHVSYKVTTWLEFLTIVFYSLSLHNFDGSMMMIKCRLLSNMPTLVCFPAKNVAVHLG